MKDGHARRAALFVFSCICACNLPSPTAPAPTPTFDVSPRAPQPQPTPEIPGDALHVVVPEGETLTATVSLSTAVRTADVVFLLDATGSMAGPIGQVRDYYIDIADSLAAVVPDVAFAVATHRDYAVAPCGGVNDAPFTLEQQITTDPARVQDALTRTIAMGGGDSPESQYEALFQLATGRGFDLDGNGVSDPQDVQPFLPLPTDAFGGLAAGKADAATPGGGVFLGAGFRPGSFRVVVQATDARYRDFETDYYMTSLGNAGTAPASRTPALDVISDSGLYVIGIATALAPVEPMTEVATVSGAVADLDGDGVADDPLVYMVNSEAVAAAITDAIVAMFTASELTVEISAEGDEWGFSSGTESMSIESVTPGDEVSFDLALSGVVAADVEDRNYTFSVKVIDSSGAILDEQPIVVTVPAG